METNFLCSLIASGETRSITKPLPSLPTIGIAAFRPSLLTSRHLLLNTQRSSVRKREIYVFAKLLALDELEDR